MKLYTRSEFIKLPAGTIYSRDSQSTLSEGLFCKISGPEITNDWIEQNLLSEPKALNGEVDGFIIHEVAEQLKESFKEFEVDLDCSGRDGCFDNSNRFIVWNRQDVKKLIDFLSQSLMTVYIEI